jgi:hypothetical protein
MFRNFEKAPEQISTNLPQRTLQGALGTPCTSSSVPVIPVDYPETEAVFGKAT